MYFVLFLAMTGHSSKPPAYRVIVFFLGLFYPCWDFYGLIPLPCWVFFCQVPSIVYVKMGWVNKLFRRPWIMLVELELIAQQFFKMGRVITPTPWRITATMLLTAISRGRDKLVGAVILLRLPPKLRITLVNSLWYFSNFIIPCLGGILISCLVILQPAFQLVFIQQVPGLSLFLLVFCPFWVGSLSDWLYSHFEV